MQLSNLKASLGWTLAAASLVLLLAPGVIFGALGGSLLRTHLEAMNRRRRLRVHGRAIQAGQLARILHQLTCCCGRYRRPSGARAVSPYNQYALTVA